MEGTNNSTKHSFDEFGTAIIVLSQISFNCFGTFKNNLLLVTLKGLPGWSASTYHVLLTNLGLANLFVCTILKPATGIYVGYAYAKMQKTVNLQFCKLYTFLTWTLLPILPWSVMVLSWQVFLGGRRKERRDKSPPQSKDEETSVMSKITSYHKASRGRNPSQRKLGQNSVVKSNQNRERKRATVETEVDSKWLRNKAMIMDEGPRPGQIIVLLLIWTGATILGIERLDTQPERGTEVKEINVNINTNVNNENR